ncbi:D-aspartate oxidase [Trichogramma pretiosum]|uniref:D-aspartate oxidase n=1 Tax=Trichogramma pretiosum TaxID=7493 RepID=UPI000C71A137|nr:D-aspartate oxidase [Trichogramma pretiosum]
MKIAVLGAGCVGVTTALELQRELPQAQISLLAADFEGITSFVAAGIFRIGTSFAGPNETITRQWIKDSYDYYEELSRSRDASEIGVAAISGYMFSNESPVVVMNDYMEKLVPIYRRATESELQLTGNVWKYGSFVSTLVTQPDIYVPWAISKLKANGAQIKRQKVNSFKEIAADYDAIVNCTGLGAKRLCSDRAMVPIKGQVIKVRAPWLKTFFYGELNTYVVPGVNGLVTLGGQREFDCSDLSICPYQSAAIKDRCDRLVPGLSKAVQVSEKAGLRPHRETGVRVEAERFSDGPGSSTLIVHNYGHGGYGICTAPGTSKYAVTKLKELHSSTAKL